MSEDRYVLNVNPGDELDVVHRNPRNECNTEATKASGVQTIDAATAKGLLARGVARRCEHCNSED